MICRILLVALAWLAAALFVAAWVRAATRPIPATRWQEGDDGVQPWDVRSVTLASGGETRVYWH